VHDARGRGIANATVEVVDRNTGEIIKTITTPPSGDYKAYAPHPAPLLDTYWKASRVLGKRQEGRRQRQGGVKAAKHFYPGRDNLPIRPPGGFLQSCSVTIPVGTPIFALQLV
jgi:hypothetical protein